MMSFTDFIWVNIAFVLMVFLFDFGLSDNKRFSINRWLLLLIPVFSCAVLVSFKSEMVEGIMPLSVVALPTFDIGQNIVSGFSFPFLKAYLGIGILILLKSIIQSFRHYYRDGKRLNSDSKYQIISVKKNGNYSLFNRIILDENDADNQLILKHEEAHLDQRHSFDLLFSELLIALLWINPLVWRWKILIKQNHEFLADEKLMLGMGEEAREYVHLLLDRALNTNQFSLGNYFSLNSLISKRIIMLNKTKKQKVWKTIALASLMLSSAVYMASCNKSDSVKVERNANIGGIEEVMDQSLRSEVVSKAEVMPKFIGGDEELINYLSANIKYPEECKKQQIEGMVFITFVIDENGEVIGVKSVDKAKKKIDERLVASAVKTISDMPNWTPGMDKGKNVKVAMAIPINFKLPKAKK